MPGVGAPHHFAENPSVGVGEVAAARIGRPQRRDLGKPAGHPVPVADVVDRDAVGHVRHARPVGQHVPNGDRRLAVGGVPRPVAGYRGVIAQQPPLGLQVDRHDGQDLGDGEDREQGAGIDLAGRALGEDADRFIEHQVAAAVHGNLHADLSPLQAPLQGIPYAGPCRFLARHRYLVTRPGVAPARSAR
jgi:hypothetical protein